MRPAVGHGGRPTKEDAGSLPAVDLSVRPQCSGGQIIRQAAGRRQVADKHGGAALPAPAGRGSRGERICEAQQNHDRCGNAHLACVFITQPQRPLTYFPACSRMEFEPGPALYSEGDSN